MTRYSFASLLLAACGTDFVPPVEPDAPQPDAPPADEFTTAERAQLATLTLSTLGPPADPTNVYADSDAAALLGQMVFFDKSYAGPIVVGDDGANHGLGRIGETGKVSCHSCHGVGSGALDDQRTHPNHVSLGTNFGTRNAHGLVNSSFYAWSNWGGRFDSQWSLPLAVAENAAIMNSTRLAVVHMLYSKYRTEYAAAFQTALPVSLEDTARFPLTGKPGDAAWTAMAADDQLLVNRIYANFGKALAAYTRTLISRDSPFDRFVAGDETAIDGAAKRGIHIFLKECASCHSGPNLADDKFHALAVPQVGVGVPATDLGRFQDIPALLASSFNSNSAFSDSTTTERLMDLAQTDDQKGQFRTKSLRNVATSAPYMHAGQFATLEAVVDFYNDGGGDVSGIVKDARIHPLSLTIDEKSDLVALLETFTGESVPANRLVDLSR